MKLKSLIAVGLGLSLLGFVSPAFAALPVVNTFTIPTTGVSPVSVITFTASDSDGTVVGYMITQTSNKPAATDSRWTATPWTSIATTSIGAITLYAWAKDNANGVSNSKTAATNVVAGHNHDAVYVNEGQANSISTPMIVNGAVTDAKISGVISAAKLPVGTTPGTIASGDHDHNTLYQQKYGKVAVVAQLGGDFTDPVIAMDSLATWCGTPSSDNPCLLKIMPGNYNIGNSSLHMSRFIDVEGSGENVTRIMGNVDGTGFVNGLIFGASDSEIRFLTLENIAGGFAIVMTNDNASPKVTNVTLAVRSSYSWGMVNYNAAPILTNVVIDVWGSSQAVGVQTDLGSSVEMLNTNITVGGYSCYGVTGNDSISMKNVELKASCTQNPNWNFAIYNTIAKIVNSTVSGQVTGSSGSSRYVANTELDGALSNGTWRCINVYDSNFSPVTCP